MITFIMPSYNQGPFIEYAIGSVIANMGASDQLIIADGASKDNTGEVVAKFLGDPRITWFTEPDRGFSDAVTKALRRAKNPLIGIMSSDDAYIPNVRERVLAHFEDSALALVYGDYDVIDVHNNKIGQRRHTSGTLCDILSLRVLLPQSSVFFRLSALANQHILSLDHDYIADVVLFNQVCMAGNFKYVPEVWSQVRKHGGSRTGKRNPGLQYLAAIDDLFSSLDSAVLQKARAGAMLLTARYQASSRQRLRALATALAAIRIDPAIANHWLLPRTLAYSLLGPGGVGALDTWRQALHSR